MTAVIALTNSLPNPRSEDRDDGVERLLPLVYAELKALAGSFLRGRPGHSLQPTALVHEAYMKLASKDRHFAGRDHFVATAARAMRQVLVDHARGKTRDKRGGGEPRHRVRISAISEAENGPGTPSSRELRVLELDELLTRLSRDDERAAKVAEMRLFGGMDQDQIARVLGISRMTVSADWQFARAWLASEYGGNPDA